MIVDSSALLAILQLEPEAERLARAVARELESPNFSCKLVGSKHRGIYSRW